MLYQTVKPILSFAVSLYFRELRCTGSSQVEDGPLLIVANHPNAMLDPVLVASIYKRPLWFIAKSTLFRGKLVHSVLQSLHLVPINRKQDNPDQPIDNKAAFRFVSESLKKKRAVLIFPEGTSLGGRKILPVKTGAARMAFQAESESDFSLDMKIQPVGITYGDIFQFDSSVTVHVDKEILLSDYYQDYQSDPQGTVKALSSRIEERLKAVTAEVAEEADEAFVVKISKLYRSLGSELDDQERIQKVAANVEQLKPKYPERRADIERRLDHYLELSSALHLDGSESLEKSVDTPFLALVAPFVVFGFLTHLLPYQFIRSRVEKRKDETWALASYKFALGTVVFPVWYALLSALVVIFSCRLLFGLLTFALLVVSGYYTKKYLRHLNLYALTFLWPGRKTPLEIVRQLRDELLSELEELRVN